MAGNIYEFGAMNREKAASIAIKLFNEVEEQLKKEDYEKELAAAMRGELTE